MDIFKLGDKILALLEAVFGFCDRKGRMDRTVRNGWNA